MSTQTVGPSDPRLEPPRLLLTGEPGAHSAGRPDLKLAYARIRRGAIRGAAEDSPPWQITIVPPVGDATSQGVSPFDLWGDLIERIVNADALIAFQSDHEGLRCGVDLTMAFWRSLPILWLHDVRQRVSPEVAALEQHAFAMTIESFDQAEELETIVSHWVQTYSHALRAAPTLRASASQVWEPLQTELFSAWRDVCRSPDATEIAKLCFLAGMTPRQIELVVRSPHLVSTIPLLKILLLGTVLNVKVQDFVGGLSRAPELTIDEEDALDSWQASEKYGDALRRVIEDAAREWKRRHRKIERKRIEAGSPARKQGYNFLHAPDWGTFYRDWRDGKIA